MRCHYLFTLARLELSQSLPLLFPKHYSASSILVLLSTPQELILKAQVALPCTGTVQLPAMDFQEIANRFLGSPLCIAPSSTSSNCFGYCNSDTCFLSSTGPPYSTQTADSYTVGRKSSPGRQLGHLCCLPHAYPLSQEPQYYIACQCLKSADSHILTSLGIFLAPSSVSYPIMDGVEV